MLRLLFLLTLLPGLIVVGLLVLGLRETTATEPTENRLQLTLRPFDRKFRLYLLALVVFTLGNSSDAFLLVRASELGIPTAMLPLLWFAFHIVKSGGNLFVGGLVDRVGPRLPLFAGWFVYASVYIAFGLATTAWHAWTLFLVYGVFYALWASWGDYDRRQFERVCKDLKFGYPFGPSHLNVKSLFAAAVGSGHEMGLDGAYKQLGLIMEGTHHRGDDDAWNIAGILCRLLREMRGRAAE